MKARGGTPGPSVPNDPRPEWAHEPSAMTVADLRGVVVPVRPVGEGAIACVPGFRFTPPGAFAMRPVAAPNRLLPTTSVPPMIRSESRGTRPGGPPDDGGNGVWRQWGQICPFDIWMRSMPTKLRIPCAAAASRTPGPPPQSPLEAKIGKRVKFTTRYHGPDPSIRSAFGPDDDLSNG